MRLSLEWEYYDSAFGMCDVNPATGNSWNLDAMRAWDALFPGAVRVLQFHINVMSCNVTRGTRSSPTRCVSCSVIQT